MAQATIPLAQLYEQDYARWLDEMVGALRAGNLSQLDYEHLIEELEALGRSERNAVASLTIQILVHLLLYKYWDVERERNGRHWQVEILTFRTQLNLKLSTHLRNYLEQNLNTLYKKAYKIAVLKSQLSLPQDNPFALEEVIDEDWLPKI
ncbi:DUF29 domain-containing protein [[Limnothrix rosea] IAM M-220]|uniref:DUF29 domain-containing protein n=1 Tax=[Limnothrix rosea] IAM M-220 TaxID=454133 RepID=UPI00095C1266|nr:DUF29 domain-containing protein [[Limnothrix rosea] IAM M-220]OKH18428.1 hypothetical protein NIES208_05550 [[Limnothrix rosea] IAM M-220]